MVPTACASLVAFAVKYIYLPHTAVGGVSMKYRLGLTFSETFYTIEQIYARQYVIMS